ncbi:MAG: YbbR-like domain-containing protein [Bacteroidia bacterium]|nr:YbbR-like domain-containing protein [Bacteroidia bacterium]
MAKQEGNSIKQKLMRGKLSAFLICLAISGFLWLSHSLNRSYFYSLNIPVKFVNLPANKTLLSDLPNQLRFDIKTSGLKLFFVLLNKPFNPITIDFNSLKGDNKSQTYAISSGNINITSSTRLDVDIKKISPDTLFFAAKKGLNKNVPIRPVIYANADRGFILSKAIINPAYITINGDSASLRSIDSISTVPLYLNQLSVNYNGKLNLVRPSENVYLNLNEVSVSISADKLLEKEIDVEVVALNCPANMVPKLFPSKVKIKFSSAKNDFNDITEKDFKAVVNLGKQKKGINKLPVELSILPTEAHVLSIEPSDIEFLLFKAK